MVSQSFAYTGDAQSYTAPADGDYTWTLHGAQGGGDAHGEAGGLGGQVTASLHLAAGTTVHVYVGGRPDNTTGGFNGGGNCTVTFGEAGGGATDIRVGGTSLSDRVLVAGGGGATDNLGAPAGDGGGLTGGRGYADDGTSKYGGLGGTQSHGGAGDGSGSPDGTFGLGGYGQYGGGGGGWYGGGGSYAAGGGGSGYAASSATGVSMSNGVQSGNGAATVNYTAGSGGGDDGGGGGGTADNLLPYADESFESGLTTGYPGYNSSKNCTIGSSSGHAKDGTHAMDVTASAAGQVEVIYSSAFGLNAEPLANRTYFWVYTTAEGRTATVKMSYYDSSSAYIGNDNYDQSNIPAVQLTANTWTQVPLDLNPPSNTDNYYMYFDINNSVAGDVYRVDEVFIGTISGSGSTPDPPTTGGSGTSPPSSTPQPNGIAGSWSLVFSDEFHGTSLDTTKWRPGWFATTTSNPVNSNEEAAYASDHVSLPGDETCHLALTNDSITAPNGTTYPNTAAIINTNPHDGRSSGGFEFTYGVVEYRAFLPEYTDVIANWPACWTDGQQVTWPDHGEFDLVEGLQGHASWHYHAPDASGNDVNEGATPSGDYSGWHTFAYEWNSEAITFYYDGVSVGQVTQDILSFPQYLMATNTCSSTVGGPTQPATMQLDYVRVWQATAAETLPTVRYVAAGTLPQPGAQHTVTTDSSPQVGDVLLVIQSNDDSLSIAAPDGSWTERAACVTGRNPWSRAWTSDVSTAGKQSVTFNTNNNYTDKQYAIWVLADAVFDVASAAHGSSNSQSAATVITSQPDELVIYDWQSGSGTQPSTTLPSALTKGYNVPASTNYTTKTGGYEIAASAGGTSTRTLSTTGSAVWCGVTLAFAGATVSVTATASLAATGALFPQAHPVEVGQALLAATGSLAEQTTASIEASAPLFATTGLTSTTTSTATDRAALVAETSLTGKEQVFVPARLTTLSGQTSLTEDSAITAPAGAALSAATNLSSASRGGVSSQVPLTATGLLTESTKVTTPAKAGLIAEAGLVGHPGVMEPSAVSLQAFGVISAPTEVRGSGAALLGATGGLAEISRMRIVGRVLLDAEARISSSGIGATPSRTLLAATTALAGVSRHAIPGRTLLAGTAELLAATQPELTRGQALLASHGALGVRGAVRLAEQARLTAVARLAAATQVAVSASPVLLARTTLHERAQEGFPEQVALAAAGVLAAAPEVTTPSQAALAASTALDAPSRETTSGRASLSAETALASLGTARVSIEALFAGRAVLGVAGEVSGTAGAALSVTGRLAGMALREQPGTVVLAAVGALQGGGASTVAGHSLLRATGGLVAIQELRVSLQALLGASAEMGIMGSGGAQLQVALAAQAVLSGLGGSIVPGTVVLSATGGLAGIPVAHADIAAGLAATAQLVATTSGAASGIAVLRAEGGLLAPEGVGTTGVVVLVIQAGLGTEGRVGVPGDALLGARAHLGGLPGIREPGTALLSAISGLSSRSGTTVFPQGVLLATATIHGGGLAAISDAVALRGAAALLGTGRAGHDLDTRLSAVTGLLATGAGREGAAVTLHGTGGIGSIGGIETAGEATLATIALLSTRPRATLQVGVGLAATGSMTGFSLAVTRDAATLRLVAHLVIHPNRAGLSVVLRLDVQVPTRLAARDIDAQIDGLSFGYALAGPRLGVWTVLSPRLNTWSVSAPWIQEEPMIPSATMTPTIPEILAVTREYLHVTWSTDVLLDDQVVEMCLLPKGYRVTNESPWLAAAWEGDADVRRSCRLIVGADTQVPLSVGLLTVFSRLTDRPERPIREAGSVKVT